MKGDILQPIALFIAGISILGFGISIVEDNGSGGGVTIMIGLIVILVDIIYISRNF